MTDCILILATYAALVLQTSVVPALPWSGMPPELLHVLACLAMLLHREWRAVLWVAALGLLSDCLSSGPVGYGMLSATLVATLFETWRRNQPHLSPWTMTTAALLGLCVVSVAQGAGRILGTSEIVSWGVLFEHAAGRAFASLVLLFVLLIGGRTVRRILPVARWPRSRANRGSERFSYR